jgi:hypothetical protein
VNGLCSPTDNHLPLNTNYSDSGAHLDFSIVLDRVFLKNLLLTVLRTAEQDNDGNLPSGNDGRDRPNQIMLCAKIHVSELPFAPSHCKVLN